MKTGIFVSIMVACVLFSTSIAVMYLAEVESSIIKASVSCSVFVLGIVVGIVYMYCITKKNRLLRAVQELCDSFQKDVQTVLKSPIRLADLEQQAKVLIIVEAVNLLKNYLVQTFKIQGNAKVLQGYRMQLFMSLNQLIQETQLNLLELTKESRRTLSRFER
jgi:hypothetical protein